MFLELPTPLCGLRFSKLELGLHLRSNLRGS